MIIDDLHIKRIAFSPAETNPPLFIDSNAVLSHAVTAQGFEPISWRRAKIFEPSNRREYFELAPRDALNAAKPPYRVVVREIVSVATSEAANHLQ